MTAKNSFISIISIFFVFMAFALAAPYIQELVGILFDMYINGYF